MQALGKFQILANTPLVYENLPRKIWVPAIGSLNMAGGGWGQNPARWRPGLVGRGGEKVKDLTGD
jgi:hypothetical protein